MQQTDRYLLAFSDYLSRGYADPLMAFVAQDSHKNARTVMQLYRNGFYKSCIGALKANFPVLQTLISEMEFKNLARRYVEQWPPEHGTLVEYGHHFADFISEMLPSSVYLADLARLDLAWLVCLNEADGGAVTTEQIAELVKQQQDLGELLIGLAPSVRLLTLQYDVLPYWQAFKQAECPAIPSWQPQLQHVLLWKRDGCVRVQPITSAQWSFLHELDTRKNLYRASEIALAVDSEFEVSEFFSLSIEQALLMYMEN
ncbi:putative DNA-binding domain-containing protein [Gynuella sp.]|uniref:HvfC/BufC family peptide modification chaperone n=1 Tax=Gynuella sp. TaxID=2969146 RepID=UPI003D10A6FA